MIGALPGACTMTSDRELTRTYEPNPVLRAIYQRFFDKIQVDEAWLREVRALSERGSIVYVLRSLNFIDFFALDYLTKRYHLPQVRFVNDLGLWILNPMGKGWLNAILPRPNVSPSDELEDDLLDKAWGLEADSRLSCQALVQDADLVVEIPRYTINMAREGKH